ncbi:gastrin/cholecystokinin-like peptide [Alligator sinensis]|uniref:Gastrin/cholecystokinin-like peptide n=1 Tax=Alligator sinensis TaxID=38654 RepID=A0A3Q0HIJ8_ALLSI|nr:gastrin/cholecystokinin-like peptide [Alligator sinensis]XP_025070302.1 gastrin/cholecystokinin-like peptide [Alligator sinensis]XP_025070303.1 gastrin/cholecystokinin-like peptide [Alligator sinensis]
MKGKVYMCLLLAILVTACLSRATSDARQLGSAPDTNGMPHRSSPAHAKLVRRDWLASLSQDQKHLISKFLPHIYGAELANQENYWHEDDALHDHDYPGWMDFGRRSIEDLEGDS